MSVRGRQGSLAEEDETRREIDLGETFEVVVMMSTKR